MPVIGGENFVTTVFIGDSKKPTLVMTHGFNGSVFLFYKALQPLKEHFRLILFDIIGMGTSSRPAFNLNEPAQVDEFFLSVFESWRSTLNLTDFYLAAHSFGGYVMGTYASKHPEHIKKLILLSPLGVKTRPDNFNVKRMHYPSGYGPPQWAKGISEKFCGKVNP